MKDIPAQLNAIRKTTLGDIIISFRVDEMYNESVQELFLKKIGTEFVMKLEDVTSSTVLGGTDSNKDAKERFWSKMHALLALDAETRGWTPEQSKDNLKNWLISEEMIEKSTKELDIKGLAKACNQLESWINHAKK